MDREKWVALSSDLSELMKEMHKVMKKYDVEHLTVGLSTEKGGVPLILGGKYETYFHENEAVFKEDDLPYRRKIGHRISA